MTASFDRGSSVAAVSVAYRFAVDGFDADHFRVHAFGGREAMSEHYRFDVVVTAKTE